MEENIPENELSNNEPAMQDAIAVGGLFENWFLEYASYVILERAVPSIEDGLKPVQRRIFHAMNEMDDGRFNKVANIIGQTMQFHPHGDASIGDAIVNLGQKNLLIDTQGNWGDVRTGDGAAAPRYIEARLSKLALDILFNPQTTEWQLSYDGRKREPVTLPVKFPLLLAQGVEGIAVGLSTSILPHNFCELCEASIAHLQNKPFELYPDFLTAGMVDVSEYKDGNRGGKVRVRAHIEDVDKKMVVIKDLPYGVTSDKLIESIIKASDSGKIKIKKVIDNTAKDVEIQVHLAPGVSPDITIDALYAFTLCQNSVSPNACIIIADKPHFVGVSDILKICTEQTKELLRRELEIRKAELMEKILFSSLEKIFIENRIYRDIEECETWDAVISTIDKGLDPFKPQFYRVITTDDIVRLTEIKIKRISKFDGFKADELIRNLEKELAETEHRLNHLRDYTIAWYKELLKKYGKGRERLTEIRQFDNISAVVVAANNQKLYLNRADGFLGYSLKKDEYICDCSDLDDVIVFLKNGTYKVVKIGEKVFVGKNVEYVWVYRKGDERTTYNVTYLDTETGHTMVKRFQVTGVTRDKEYTVHKGGKNDKMTYFSANPNGEAEVVTVKLTPASTARNKIFDFDFSTVAIKGRAAGGNILTRYPVKEVKFKAKGKSTLGGQEVWYDAAVGKLNTTGHGAKLADFEPDDLILAVYKDGTYELDAFALTNRYDNELLRHLGKFDKDALVNIIHYEASQKAWYFKKFLIDTTTTGKRFQCNSGEKGSFILAAAIGNELHLKVDFYTDLKKKVTQSIDFTTQQLLPKEVGRTAMGAKLLQQNIAEAIFTPIEKEEIVETEKAEG